MCKKKQFKYCPSEIDECMKRLIEFLNNVGYKTLGCCCGHGRYNMTLVMRNGLGEIIDLMSGVKIPRKKKFYKKDKQGYYFIPEAIENLK